MRMRHIAICGLPRFYNIFPHYLINGTIFEKKLLKTKCVFWISLQLLSVTFLILRRNERDVITDVYRSSCKVPVIVVRFQRNYNFLDRFFFEKYSNVKFHEIPPSGSPVVLCGRTDRHDETNSLLFATLQTRPKTILFSLKMEHTCRNML